MAWSRPEAKSWHRLWVTVKPRDGQGSASADLPHPGAFHTHQDRLKCRAEVRLGAPVPQKPHLSATAHQPCTGFSQSTASARSTSL